MSQYSILFTQVGRDKIAAATAGDPLTITHIAVGDGGGGYPPIDDTITSLVNEIGRFELTGTSTPVPTQRQFSANVDSSIGPAVIRERGLIDEDGDLIAIAQGEPVSIPDPNGPEAVDIIVSMSASFSNADHIKAIVNLQGYVRSERKVNTADGMEGGGDLTQDRTIRPKYGKEAKTVAEGNHTHDWSEITGMSNLPPSYPELEKYTYITTSQNIPAKKTGVLTIRAMGAGGGGGYNNPGGNGGTVAIKKVNVVAGDDIEVIIPAGGNGGNPSTPATNGGDLIVKINDSQALLIPGGKAAELDNDEPIGADWFCLGTTVAGAGNYGGGAAMIVEGGTRPGRVNGASGAGALGDSYEIYGGGCISSATASAPGGGFLTVDKCILRYMELTTSTARTTAGFISGGFFNGGWGGKGGFGGGGSYFTASAGSAVHIGGFGGGGGGFGGENGGGAKGGFGGGGGAANTADSRSYGGNGGQGFVTLEWEV